MTRLTKPVRRVADSRNRMPHGFSQTLVVTLYPGAVVGVREHRHKNELTLDLGEWYATALTRAALAALAARRRAKRGKP